MKCCCKGLFNLIASRSKARDFLKKAVNMVSSFNQPDEILLSALKEVVGDTGWKSGADASRYFDDPRGRFKGKGRLIVLPNSTEQVAAVVRLCNAARVGIVPFSGGTGVVAGQLSICSDNAIVVSLERMNKVRDISVDDGVMVAEAGCVLENIHNTAAQHGLVFPLNMASKGSCCIGGNLATNAGGIQVVRHGNARDLCLGIEAVLPDGSVYRDLSPLRKNNTGYDLRHLLIGSEGTLAIITAATLVLKPIDPETVTVFCAINSPADALTLYRQVRPHLGDSISAIELMSGFGIGLVTEHFRALNKPFAQYHDWYVLLEASGSAGLGERVEAALAECLDSELVNDVVIAQSQSQRNSLWDLREHTPAANRLAGAFCNSDTSVPIGKVNDFIERTVKVVLDIQPGLRINSYGHIGDGNIHHSILPPGGVEKYDFIAANPGVVEAVRMAINDVTRQFDGSISAEHGIGRLKTKDLELYTAKAKRDAMRTIKKALDPNSIMNPGAVIA